MNENKPLSIDEIRSFIDHYDADHIYTRVKYLTTKAVIWGIVAGKTGCTDLTRYTKTELIHWVETR